MTRDKSFDYLPVTRRRGRPARNQQSVLNEADCLRVSLAAFAELGYEGASVREIARQLGVSHGLISARYGGKAELWQAAVRYGMDYLQQRMSAAEQTGELAGADIPARLTKACVDFLLGVAEVPDMIRLMNAEGMRPGPRLDYVVQHFFRKADWPFARLLKEGQQAGLFRRVHVIIPFTMLAHGAGAVFALQPLIRAADPRWDAHMPAIDQVARQAAEVIVRGLLADPV